MPEMAWNLSGEGRLDKAINALSMLKNFIYTLGKHGPFMAAKVFVVFRTQGEPQNHTVHLTYERSLGALCLCGFVPLVLDIVCYEIVVCLQASIVQSCLLEKIRVYILTNCLEIMLKKRDLLNMTRQQVINFNLQQHNRTHP
jgi:hypothetical protein